jgi:hypothetical protein
MERVTTYSSLPRRPNNEQSKLLLTKPETVIDDRARAASASGSNRPTPVLLCATVGGRPHDVVVDQNHPARAGRRR